jgi:hypothetical protein
VARWRARPRAVPLPPEIFGPGFPLEEWLDAAFPNDPARWFEVYSLVMRTPVAGGGDGG